MTHKGNTVMEKEGLNSKSNEMNELKINLNGNKNGAKTKINENGGTVNSS
jgi:hypothetical protein